MRELSKEQAQVAEVVEALAQVRALHDELAGAREMLEEGDAELREMAKLEIERLDAEIVAETARARLLMLPKDPYEGRPILLEIRAGTGGDEAAIFAGDLFRMYSRYGEQKGLRFDVMSSNAITVPGGQGFKEIIVSVTGDRAYGLLRFEGGVHRVQRIPVTEAQGRIHTSAATVAVMPEPDEVEVRIDPKDLRIDVMRAGGPGGQSVNTTDSAVRIVHIPTGMIVQCQDEKSQLKNKEKAMRVLKARLLEKEQAERDAQEAATRKAMVGTGDRSERIRTYNFPQNRVTDHRIGLTVYRLDAVIDGDLDPIVEPLLHHHQAELLQGQAVE
jgi:peptide chain release factor 1